MSGHDEEWIDLQFEDFCPVCSFVPRDAVAHTCGQLFCLQCWENWKATGHGCATCRQPGEAPPSNRDRRDILNFTMQCPRNCGQNFRLGDKDAHLQAVCRHRVILCPLCQMKTTPATIEVHNSEECLHRAILCSDCGAHTTPLKLLIHQQSVCTFRMIPCPLCSQQIVWKDQDQHLISDGGHLRALVEHNERLRQCLIEQATLSEAKVQQLEQRCIRLNDELRKQFDGKLQQLERQHQANLKLLETNLTLHYQASFEQMEEKIKLISGPSFDLTKLDLGAPDLEQQRLKIVQKPSPIVDPHEDLYIRELPKIQAETTQFIKKVAREVAESEAKWFKTNSLQKLLGVREDSKPTSSTHLPTERVWWFLRRSGEAERMGMIGHEGEYGLYVSLPCRWAAS